MNIDSPAKTPRIFPILLVLIAVPMILGGLQLIFLGGSFYYLLTGLLLVASAMRFWKGSPTGSLIYAGLLITTVAWALLESGTVKLHPNLTHYPHIFALNFDPWITLEKPENTRSIRVNY